MLKNYRFKVGAFGVPLLLFSLPFAAFGQTPPTSEGVRFVAPRFENTEPAPVAEETPTSVAPLPENDGAAQGLDATTEEGASLELTLEPEAETAKVAEETPVEDAPQAEETEPKETTKPAASNQVERAPYDPIKENGEYFVGWEKPQVALVFTGLTNGYIEPCGCAGMDRMKGGLSRRRDFLKNLRETRGWDVVAVDAGQTTVGFGVQEELKFDMAMNAFRLMEYDAIGIGKGELRFPAYFLLTFTAPTAADSASLFTSANVGVYGFHDAYALPLKVVERGGLKIGVVSVVCPSEDLDHRDENLLLESPEKKLAELAPRMKKAACDKWTLIVHGTEAETEALAKKFPIFDFVLTADSPSAPPAEAKSLGGDRMLIEVGEKGKYAVVLGLYESGEIRYQRVALDSRFESSEDVALLMQDYQSILKTLITLKGHREGLGLNPAREPRSEQLGKFVGSQKCQSCHEEEHRIWLRSRHANAWKSLTDVANPPRDFDPECVGCHVVGWDGLQRFPYVDGFVTAENTPHLLNVGCENCHGPGEKHIAAELGDDEAKMEEIRAGMRLGSSVKTTCYSCHDADNSPEFDFDRYYPLIDHSVPDDEDEESGEEE
jgi:hypothetical protein